MKKMMDFSLVDEFSKKTAEEMENIEPLNILVVGKTGVGKSTLINALFREQLAKTGIGKPITQHLQKITKEGVPLHLYDTRGLELESESQIQIVEEIKTVISELKKQSDQLDVIYYCMHAGTSRVETFELDLIKQLTKEAPVILVLTQSLGDQAKAFATYIEELMLPIQQVVPVMAKDYRINDEMTVPAFGLHDLLEATFQTISEDRHFAFNNAQQVDIERKVKAARRWANKYMATTFGVGFTPIPFADATVLVPMQIGMLAHITAIFGVSMEKSTLISIIGALGGTGGATYLGRLIVSNVLKFIPGIGTTAGGVVSGATAAIVTSALAMSYIEMMAVIATHEAQDLPLDAKQLKKLLRERFEVRMKRSGKLKSITDIIKTNETEVTSEETPKKGLKKFFTRR